MAPGRKVLYEFGPFRIDPDAQLLLRDREPIPLTPKGFETLLALVRHSREDVSKEDLMKAVWPRGFVEEGNLSQNIFLIRKALGDTSDERRYIVTLPGRGYRFAADVRTVVQEPDDLVIHSRSRSQIVVERTETALHESALARIRRLLTWKAGAAVALIAAIAIGAGVYFRARTPPPVSGTRSVLIGDFSNSTGDPVFDGGLRVALRLKLAESPYLTLLSQAEGCEKQPASSLLRGAVARESDGTYRVQLSATDCADGHTLAREEARAGSRDGVLAALGQAADAVRTQLGEPSRSLTGFRTPIEQATTASLAALKAFSLGEEKRAQGEDFDTVPFYKMATDLDPDFALAYARLGTIYSNAQDAETSRGYFDKAFELRAHAGERERLYITAHHYASTGETDKLVKTYELWREIYPQDLVPANNLLEVYLTMGRPDLALATAREAVRLAPDNGFALASLLRAYEKSGRYAEAKSLYDEIVTRKLDGIVPHVTRAIIAGAEHDDAEMGRQLEWARGKSQEAEILNVAAVAALGRGEFRAAREILNKAVRSAASSGLPNFEPVCLREFAESAAEVGLTDDARASIERALQLNPDSHLVLASAALVFGNAGDLERADEFAKLSAEKSPADFALHRILLPTARAAGDLRHGAPDAALRELQSVEPYDLSWDMDLSPIYYRGLAYLKSKQPREAISQFQKLLAHRSLRPDTIHIPLAQLAIARAHLLEGDRNRARTEYEAFFESWKGADPGIPILQAARAEYASLE